MRRRSPPASSRKAACARARPGVTSTPSPTTIPTTLSCILAIRIGAGRSPDARKQAGQTIFAALIAALEEVFAARPLGISMELTESNPEMSWKRNNLHDTIAHRKGGPAA